MTLSAEQFNKLVTRDEFNELKDDVKEIKNDLGKLDKILTVVDGIAKKHSNFDQDLVFNQAAHDRMQGEIDVVKEQVKQTM